MAVQRGATQSWKMLEATPHTGGFQTVEEGPGSGGGLERHLTGGAVADASAQVSIPKVQDGSEIHIET